MTKQNKIQVLSALRQATQILEKELEETPKAVRRNQFKEYADSTVGLGIWRKPDFLKKSKSKQ